MPNSLKLKLSRVVPPFQLCRSKKPSSLAETPSPSIYRLSPVNPKALDINYSNLPAPPPSTPYDKCHASRKIVSVGCKCCPLSGSCSHCCVSSDWSVESPDFQWKKEVKRQAKPLRNVSFSFSDESGDMSPMFMLPEKSRNKSKEITNKKRNDTRTSTALCVDTSGCFSSTDDVGDDQETETLLFSSRSFSYDSSCEFIRSLDSTTDKSGYENYKKYLGKNEGSNLQKIKNFGRQVSLRKRKGYKGASSPGIPSAVRPTVMKRMIACTDDGKVRDSTAVVLKSKDPYRDFKKSMLEMILERQIFEAEDLEELLQCFCL